MKFVFLDIDGVLNSHGDFFTPDGRLRKSSPRVRTPYGTVYDGVSQDKVRQLARIVAETGALIVLCSSWKAYYERYRKGMPDDHVGKYLSNALSRQKVRIFDTTLRNERYPSLRGEGIKAWLRAWDASHPENRAESFVILDDEPFDYAGEGLIGNWVQTYDGIAGGGLTKEEADDAIRLLNEKQLQTED